MLEPRVGLIEELFECRATVVAGDGFVQVQPDPFDRVGLRCILGQEVKVSPFGKVVLHVPAAVNDRIVPMTWIFE